MLINPYIFPTLLIGLGLFYLGLLLSRRFRSTKSAVMIALVFLILCIPGILIDAHYLRIFDDEPWYVEFRSIPGVEILNSLWGLLLGFGAGFLCRDGSDGNKVRNASFTRAFIVLFMVISIVPFVKPIIFPARKFCYFVNRWTDGACLQSSPFTCGPAATATVLSMFGITRTEEEVARNTYTCYRGTECWYMIRYARREGLTAKCGKCRELSSIKAPSILGTRLGRIGHFIVFAGFEGENLIIYDSLEGRLVISREEFGQRYSFDGFYISFYK